MVCHMEGMIDDNEKGPAREWIKAIDQGDLVYISNKAFHLFLLIELSVRRYIPYSEEHC